MNESVQSTKIEGKKDDFYNLQKSSFLCINYCFIFIYTLNRITV